MSAPDKYAGMQRHSKSVLDAAAVPGHNRHPQYDIGNGWTARKYWTAAGDGWTLINAAQSDRIDLPADSVKRLRDILAITGDER